MKVVKIAATATLTALCVALNYALIGVPNVSLMDFIVFMGGFYFGWKVGVSVGVLSWAMYGALNPFGFVPQIWIATMFSEAVFGLIGGLLGRSMADINLGEYGLRLNVLFGAVGFLTTLFYDLATNLVYSSSFGIPIMVALIFGAPFTILHEASNALIFGFGSILTINLVRGVR
jgi:uncharacterized membrane protein